MANGKSVTEMSPAREMLHRKEAGAGPHPPRPLDHLAFSILLDSGAGVTESLAAIGRLRQEFVDWNEVRVARTQEVARALGGIPDAERSALKIKEEYNDFFEKKGALNFEFLAVGKPAETRRVLVQLLPHLAKGAVSLLLYEFCAGAALPLSDEGMRQARKDGAVGKNADRNQLARLLAESLEPAEIAILVQYWELEAVNHPYGEVGRKESAHGPKKTKKAPAKAKGKSADKR